MKKLTTILTIAGSDSSGGAGIQADIKTATANRVFASSVVTAVTSQSTSGISHIHLIPANDVRTQLESVFLDQKPDAIKIGMVGSVECLETISSFLKQNAGGIPVVADPVMSSTSGRVLNGTVREYAEAFLSELSPLSTVVTPNIPEAKIFLETREVPLSTFGHNAETTVSLLNCIGSRSVVLKGGHSSLEIVADYLAVRKNDNSIVSKAFIARKEDSMNLHGTGCVYSTLMACALALGKSIPEAFLFASEKINFYIKACSGYYFGASGNGPLNVASYHIKQS